MAEYFARHRSDPATVRVSSAGTAATLGECPPEVVDEMAARGIDVTGHRSRQLEPAMVGSADLVIGMAREHLRAAALAEPAAAGRCFTLKEFVRRADQVPPGPLPQRLEAMAAGRSHAELLGASADDDVEDPIGRRQKVYARVASEIEQLTAAVVDLLPAGMEANR